MLLKRVQIGPAVCQMQLSEVLIDNSTLILARLWSFKVEKTSHFDFNIHGYEMLNQAN